MSIITRRDFLKKSALLSATAASLHIPYAVLGLTQKGDEQPFDLAVVEGEEVRASVRKAVDLIGGMSKFVKKGQVVVVKPNMAWDRMPEQAANTNPAETATAEPIEEVPGEYS